MALPLAQHTTLLQIFRVVTVKVYRLVRYSLLATKILVPRLLEANYTPGPQHLRAM